LPPVGSKLEKTLNEIYEFYSSQKHLFEALAAEATAQYLRMQGIQYRDGWITPKSSDHGADFYGCINVGSGFGSAKIILLGQAKCEKTSTPTGGNHIARTVARLKRGWVGSYVTTSYFSDPVQEEIIEDAYPIILINGKKLAEITETIVYNGGYNSVKEYLTHLNDQYASKVKYRRPEELLLE
jgi:hypothetical protein